MLPSRRPSQGPVDPSLDALLAGIRAGRESDLAAFYDATRELVYGFALRIVRDRSIAEEVTLDVYLQIWRQAASYRPERGSPETWLLTIARTRSIDRLRSTRARRRREEPLDGRLEAGIDRPGQSEEPGRRIEEAERRESVAAALRKLPSAQRQAVELAFFEGLTHHEISLHLDLPLGTVKTRIRLGMLRLRDFLREIEGP